MMPNVKPRTVAKLTPITVRDFAKVRPAFNAWLIANGSAILEPTNRYEVARFLTALGTGVIYRNDGNRLSSWQGGAAEAFHAFQAGKPWRARDRTARRSGKARNMFLSLIARDGWACMYCGHAVTDETATIEHVVAVTHGGPNHLANLSLAHGDCNQAAGHLSAREKLERALVLRCSVPIAANALPATPNDGAAA